MYRLFIISFVLLVAACSQPDSSHLEVENKKVGLRRVIDKIKQSGDLATASNLQAQIVQLDPRDIEAFVALARTLKELGEREQALEILETGAKVNPDNDLLKFEVAKAFIENDQPETALARLDLVDVNNIDFTAEFYNAKGIAHDKLGNSIKAQAAYKKGLENEPRNGLLLNNLALSQILNGQAEQAVIILEELVKRKDAKPRYRHNLALAYGLLNEEKKARRVLLQDLHRTEAEQNLEYYRVMREEYPLNAAQLPVAPIAKPTPPIEVISEIIPPVEESKDE